MRCYLHAKIHRATVTDANLDYMGSITVDRALLQKTGLAPGEKVLVSNITNGNRLETYILAGNSGEMCMNGAAAHLAKRGDKIIVMAFEWSLTPVAAKVILVDENNGFIRYLTEEPGIIENG